MVHEEWDQLPSFPALKVSSMVLPKIGTRPALQIVVINAGQGPFNTRPEAAIQARDSHRDFGGNAGLGT